MSNEMQVQDLPAVVDIDRPMSVKEVLTQSLIVHEILTRVMVQDIHYGTLPGCKKPSLYQPGAEKICTTFRLAPKYETEDLSEPRDNFYRYRVRCSLYTIRDGLFVGSAMGEASTAEEKYQWEAALNQRHFDATDPDKRRIKFKKNAHVDGGVEEILQVQQNAADLANTVLKMACKRALTSVTKGATAASDIFDVDLEEEAVGKLAKDEQEALPKPKAKAAPLPKLGFREHKGKHIDDPSVPLDELRWFHDYIKKGLGSEKRKPYDKQDRHMLSCLIAEIQKREQGIAIESAQHNGPAMPLERLPMDDDAWRDYCRLWQDQDEAAYADACMAFKVNDGVDLPLNRRNAFQDYLKKNKS